MFTDEMADQIIAFVLALSVCGNAAGALLRRDNPVPEPWEPLLCGNAGRQFERYFETGSPNQYVYNVLETAWIRRQLGAF